MKSKSVTGKTAPAKSVKVIPPETSYQKTEAEINEEVSDLKQTMTVVFYRQWWIKQRSEYAKQWLLTNDATWFNEHKDDIVTNQIF